MTSTQCAARDHERAVRVPALAAKVCSARDGQSPLIARTPSGGHHVYYRHNGRQRRRVRDPYWSERGIPVDVLGNGFIVAPASRSPEGTYCFVQGDLDDLQRLPLMRSVTPRIEPAAQAPTPAEQPVVPAGHRNDQLFRHCMRCAKNAQTFSDLLDVARCFNTEHCVPPLGPSSFERKTHGCNR